MSQSKKTISELEQENAGLRSTMHSLGVVQKDNDLLQVAYTNSQTRFKTIFEESSFGNKIINEDLTIIKVNKMLLKILGYSEPELTGRKTIEFTHPDFVNTWEKLREELWLASSPRDSFSIDTCLVRKDGSVVWCHVTSILFEDDGDRLGYTIVEDITDRKESDSIKEELVKQEHLLQIQNQEQARQKELFEAVVRSQEEERARIAEELHNSLGQMLYAVKIKLSLINLKSTDQEGKINALAEANKLLTESITECRRTAHNLLPRILNDFGLREAINDLGVQFRPTIDFKLEFESVAPIREKYAEIVFSDRCRNYC